MKRLVVALLFAAFSVSAMAQKVELESNAVSLIDLGTLSLEAGMSVAQHFSLHVGGKYNPWTFKLESPSLLVKDQHKVCYAGVRYWPWYVFSSWWVSMKVEYLDFLQTGVWRPAVESGRGVGVGLGVGYTKMLGEHFNLDVGIGGIGGWLFEYMLNNSQNYTSVRDSGARHFIYPDGLQVGIMYVF